MAITLYGFDGSTYVRTVRAGEVFEVKGFTPWWERMQALPSYESTAPQLGAVGLWVKLGDYSVVGRENYSGSLQPHDQRVCTDSPDGPADNRRQKKRKGDGGFC
jgi:hypothetical protein